VFGINGKIEADRISVKLFNINKLRKYPGNFKGETPGTGQMTAISVQIIDYNIYRQYLFVAKALFAAFFQEPRFDGGGRMWYKH
jgi:hypothetical protein